MRRHRLSRLAERREACRVSALVVLLLLEELVLLLMLLAHHVSVLLVKMALLLAHGGTLSLGRIMLLGLVLLHELLVVAGLLGGCRRRRRSDQSTHALRLTGRRAQLLNLTGRACDSGDIERGLHGTRQAWSSLRNVAAGCERRAAGHVAVTGSRRLHLVGTRKLRPWLGEVPS